jgi:acid phosphatase family membrane protein YuiD
MAALTTVMGIYNGLGSGLFALAAVMTMMTAYDAMMTRRSAGEQGLALRKLLALSPLAKDPLPYQALGHKPLEVAAGGLLGIGVGLIVAFLITI